MKKISVIIPVYNCEEYLDECLQSIENQTLNPKDFEVIVINDGSTDKSMEIIEKYHKKNPKWYIKDRENKGVALTRNEALKIMNAEFMTFLDSDDILEPNALEIMYKETTKNKCDIGIFRTKNFTSKEEGNDRYETTFNAINQITNLNKDPLLASIIRNAAILYKQNIVKNIEFIKNVVHEDNYFCLKAYSKADNIYISKSVVYKIRGRESENLSITQNQNFKSYKDLLENIITADKEIKNSKLIKKHANQLISYIEQNVEPKKYYEAKLYLFDYIHQMKENNIINNITYLKLQLYFKLKSLRKISKTILKDNLKTIFLSSLTIISPKLNTKVFYKRRIKKTINLDNPQTFNEKIQWLKLNELYPNELVTKCADKVEVRNYIKEKDCEEILTNVIRIYNNVNEIDFDELPNKFVLKWNFGCGYNIICNDKSKLNINVTKKMLKKWGKTKFHLKNSELHYKNIKKKIICEEFLSSNNKQQLPEDYKFYCFNGKAEYVMICKEREKGKPKFYFFDRAWNYKSFIDKVSAKEKDIKIEKPKNIDKMFKYADKLSEGFTFVRVDLYNVNNNIYFGELTFTPAAGLDTDYTEEGANLLAQSIKLKK